MVSFPSQPWLFLSTPHSTATLAAKLHRSARLLPLSARDTGSTGAWLDTRSHVSRGTWQCSVPGERGVVVDLLQHVRRVLQSRVVGPVRVADVVLVLKLTPSSDSSPLPRVRGHVTRTLCAIHVCLFSSPMPSMLRQPLQPPVWPTYLLVSIRQVS